MYNYVREYADPTMAAMSLIFIVVTALLLIIANAFLGLGKVSMSTMAAEDTAVRLDGVTRRNFGNTVALDDAWIAVSGEFMTLLGPSGCGKTTLLNLVAGFLSADRGEIFIEGARHRCQTSEPRHPA
jgi:ABC-type proline/glycine betaine transport system ATPase subunit